MRYFFHVRDDRLVTGDEGVELACLQQAQAEAVKLAGGLITDMDGLFWNRREWELVVTDATGLTLFTLYFSGTMAPSCR